MMTSTTVGARARRADILHPLPAALVGAAAFGLTMTAGDVLGINSDSADAPATTIVDIAVYAGLVLAVVALATWLGNRARSGSPAVTARYALGLALGSAVTFVAFWSGWPQVLGSVAVATALEHRRRIGGFGAMASIATVMGALALVGSAVFCVIG
jgi:hypothetical protein